MQNEKENKNLIDKVLNISESRKDVEELDNTKELNIVKLLNSQLERSTSKNELKESVITKLKAKVNDVNGEDIPLGLLIRLLEVLDRSDSDLMLGILNTGKDIAFAKSLQQKNEEGINLTKDDVEDIKKLLKSLTFLETLGKSE